MHNEFIAFLITLISAVSFGVGIIIFAYATFTIKDKDSGSVMIHQIRLSVIAACFMLVGIGVKVFLL